MQLLSLCAHIEVDRQVFVLFVAGREGGLTPIDVRYAFQLFHGGFGKPTEALANFEFARSCGHHRVHLGHQLFVAHIRFHASFFKVYPLIQVLFDARKQQLPQHQ